MRIHVLIGVSFITPKTNLESLCFNNTGRAWECLQALTE